MLRTEGEPVYERVCYVIFPSLDTLDAERSKETE